MTEREMWATKAGSIVAAVGSAVGLGNIWQPPFKTAQFGGASFLIIYIAVALGISLPVTLAEFVVGRKANLNTISAFEKLGYKEWCVVGAIGLFAGFWILSYYSVVGGWVLRYIGDGLTGVYFAASVEYFGQVSAGIEALVLHAVFMALVIGIVTADIEDDIEKTTKLMVPSIVIILATLAVFAFTLPGASAGYAYFLSPDFSALSENFAEVVPFAVGQMFSSLSFGMDTMITYASYIDSDQSLFGDGITIVFLNSFVDILAGPVVLPLLFAQGIDLNTSSAGAVFTSIAGAFGDIPGGQVIGFVFFAVVLIAVLSSAISLLEVVASWAIDNYGVSRLQMAVGLGRTIFLFGVPSTIDSARLGWFDTLAYQPLLLFSILGILVFAAWVYGAPTIDEPMKGSGLGEGVGLTWLWLARTLVIVAVVATLVLGLQALFLGESPAIVPPL